MKRLIAMLLALVALSGLALADGTEAASDAAATQAPEAEDTRPYYDMSQLGVVLYVDAGWEQYARNYDVTIAVGAEYDDEGALSHGLLMLLPSEYDSSDAATTSYDARGGIMAILVNAEGERPEIAELESFEPSELGTVEGYEFTSYMNPSPDTSLLDESGVEMVEAIRASLGAGVQDSVKLSRPATRDELTKLVGDFKTQDIYGAEVDSALLANTPYTLIDVWATSCSPCISEMPGLAALAKEYEGRVQFMGIVSDAMDEETIELARAIVEQTGVGYACVVPDYSLYTTLLSRVQYTPTKVIVDQNGQQVGNPIIGAQSEDDLRAVLEELLAD